MVLALRGIQSSDRDITYIADQGQAAYSEAISRLERINALPKPPGAGELFVSSFVDGFFGNVFGGYARSKDAEDKQNAIIDVLQESVQDKYLSVKELQPLVRSMFFSRMSGECSVLVCLSCFSSDSRNPQRTKAWD